MGRRPPATAKPKLDPALREQELLFARIRSGRLRRCPTRSLADEQQLLDQHPGPLGHLGERDAAGAENRSNAGRRGVQCHAALPDRRQAVHQDAGGDQRVNDAHLPQVTRGELAPDPSGSMIPSSHIRFRSAGECRSVPPPRRVVGLHDPNCRDTRHGGIWRRRHRPDEQVVRSRDAITLARGRRVAPPKGDCGPAGPRQERAGRGDHDAPSRHSSSRPSRGCGRPSPASSSGTRSWRGTRSGRASGRGAT